MSDGPAIRCDHLERSFTIDGSVIEVLRGIDLEIAAGEILAVIGASGVGKSTLLHIIGLLDQPTAGAVFIGGRDAWQLNVNDRAALRNREIGFVFQFHHLLPEFTALENTMMPQLINRASKAQARDRATAILTEVGLAHRLGHKPTQLSGGEQQRVALARALVNEPRILLADEPTGNLDNTTSKGIHELLLTINRERRLTCILVTHNHDLAQLSDKTVRMVDGRIFL
ncbi:ABC transporter ATP-binding protein [bacterium]|nr:ABC transporter ATP-binding protein [candidate division CSSED10-310 bacterium]